VTDASFADGAEQALVLKAETPEDMPVLSTLVQDAVLPMAEMRWDRKAGTLALLINRFRWEDRAAAETTKRPYERVRSLLVIGDVRAVASQGIDRSESDLVVSILSLVWQPGADGTGRVVLILAGDGAIKADVECLNLTLKDVTRPYLAPSGKAPDHPL
jgi:hypothetical protein